MVQLEPKLTQGRLKTLVHYDPDTGLITRKAQTSNRTKIGSVASTRTAAGYVTISLNSKPQYVHRLAFLYMIGRWPTAEVDHVNRNPSDNRWCNLREATGQQNKFNKAAQHNNKTGYKGVQFVARSASWPHPLWRVMISINGKTKHVGYFRSVEEAHKAYSSLARETQGDFYPKPT